MFNGADIDAFEAASATAMSQGSISSVPKSTLGVREAYSKLDRAVRQIRRTGAKGDVDAPLDEDGWL